MNQYKVKNFLISLFTQLIIVVPLLVFVIARYDTRDSLKESQKINNIQKAPVESLDENSVGSDFSGESNVILIVRKPFGQSEKLIWIKKINGEKKAKTNNSKNLTVVSPSKPIIQEVTLSDI
ncbi:MAG: hypothetical protein OEZ36_04250 [Spirochaetota bacterium]|nr:hypothetical protein [Spirochaetota bacterium]